MAQGFSAQAYAFFSGVFVLYSLTLQTVLVRGGTRQWGSCNQKAQNLHIGNIKTLVVILHVTGQ